MLLASLLLSIEKIYVDNESSVKRFAMDGKKTLVVSHYGSRDCRPLRELKYFYF